MPFRSKAQRRKFAELLLKGEISQETFEEWNRETGTAHLPERVKPASRRRKKATKSGSTTRQGRRTGKPARKQQRFNAGYHAPDRVGGRH